VLKRTIDYYGIISKCFRPRNFLRSLNVVRERKFTEAAWSQNMVSYSTKGYYHSAIKFLQIWYLCRYCVLPGDRQCEHAATQWAHRRLRVHWKCTTWKYIYLWSPYRIRADYNMFALWFIMVALCNRADHYIFMLWFVIAALCNRGAIIFLPCGYYLSFLA